MLSDLASGIAVWLAGQSNAGFGDLVMYAAISEAFPDASKGELAEAMYELQDQGWLTISGALGHSILHVQLEDSLFWALDEGVHARAVSLAKYLLDKDHASAPEIEREFDWTKRQLNPVLSYLIARIDPSAVRKTITADYVTLGFHIGDQERYRLKKFIAESGY